MLTAARLFAVLAALFALGCVATAVGMAWGMACAMGYVCSSEGALQGAGYFVMYMGFWFMAAAAGALVTGGLGFAFAAGRGADRWTKRGLWTGLIAAGLSAVLLVILTVLV